MEVASLATGLGVAAASRGVSKDGVAAVKDELHRGPHAESGERHPDPVCGDDHPRSQRRGAVAVAPVEEELKEGAR